jgi:tRNA ligase
VTAEPLAQDECDEVIQLRVEASLEDNLRTVLSRLKELMPALELPSKERIGQVLEQVGAYDPDVKKTLMDAAKADVTRYYAVAPEVDLPSLTREVIRNSTAGDDVKTAAEAFLARLLENRRATGRPHITLVHETEVELERLALLSLAEEQAANSSSDGPSPAAVGPWKRTWDQCVALANPTAPDGQPPLFEFFISHLVFSDKVMSLVVSSLRPSDGAPADTPTLTDVPDLQHAHFTVGTADDSLRPYEGRLLVIEQRKAGALDAGRESAEGVLVLPMEIKGQGRVVGLG